MLRRFRPLCLALVAGLVFLSGCGRRLPPSVQIAGRVTAAGQPLPEGVVFLYPLDEPGGSPVGVSFAGGRFSAPVVPKGRYRVELRSTEAYAAPAGHVSSGVEHPRRDSTPKEPLAGEIDVQGPSDDMVIALEPQRDGQPSGSAAAASGR